MKISVIIPTYKPQGYIWECLDSLFQQTLAKDDYELIIVLNGCREPYDGKIKKYLSQFEEWHVTYIQTDTGGVSNARNIGLDNACGEYITFIDDDDYVSPNYLKELLSLASEDIIALAYPYAFMDGDMKQIEYPITDSYNCRSVFRRQHYTNTRKYFSGPCMKLIHRNVIANRRFNISFKNGEDALFMFLISDRFKSVDFASKDCVYYRRYRRGSAVFSQSFSQCLKNGIRLMCEYICIFIKGNYNPWFFLTRELGAVHAILYYPINNKKSNKKSKQ